MPKSAATFYSVEGEDDDDEEDEEDEDDDANSTASPIMDLTTNMTNGDARDRGASPRNGHFGDSSGSSGEHQNGLGLSSHNQQIMAAYHHHQQQQDQEQMRGAKLSAGAGLGYGHPPHPGRQPWDGAQRGQPLAGHSPSNGEHMSASAAAFNSNADCAPSTLVLAALKKRKRRPQPIPEDCKDDAYWERRKRNNESAKRSREMRRIKEQQTTMRVIYLEQENLRLKTESDMLRGELEKLREIMYNRNSYGASGV